MKGQERIEEVFAFLTTDTDGTEGITGFALLPESGMIPMVCADKSLVDLLRPVALQIAADNPAVKIRLVRFSKRDVLEEIKPT